MKRRSISVAIAIAFVFCVDGYAAEKVGYINVQRIVSNSTMGKEAAAEITQMREAENEKIRALNEELNALKTSFAEARQQQDASETDLVAQLETIQLKDKQLQRYVADAKEYLANMASGTQGGDQPMVIGSGTTSVTSGNPTLVNGSAMFTFSAPGADNTGIVNIEADLTAANIGRLLSDWDGDGNFDNHPVGRASFGIISRPKELIYSREPW